MPDYFLPAEQRVEIIRHYGDRYRLRYFVETGTSEGFTTAALVNDFDSIQTIEIDENTHLRAVNRFARNPNVHCLFGDSGALLAQRVPRMIEPVLFWLDGHFCGGPGRGNVDTPVVEELEAALRAPQGSVILIDDARLFGGGPEHTEEFRDYPDLSWVAEKAERHNFEYFLQDDIIRLTP